MTPNGALPPPSFHLARHRPGTPTYLYPGVAYPASKAAVNMVTAQYAKAFPAMRINAVEPGYTATDLNNNTGLQRSRKEQKSSSVWHRPDQRAPPEATSTL